MSDPILNKLGAYVDGELNQRGRAEVEAHLVTCENCRNELESLQRLTSQLRTAPEPEFTPASDFKAQFMLQLPRRDESLNPAPNGKMALWLAPALVLVVLIFIQVTMGLSSLVTLANQVGLLDGVHGWTATAPQETLWFTAVQTTIGSLQEWQGFSWLQILNDAGLFTQNVLITLLLEATAAIIYWGVLAFVWRGSSNPLAAK